LSSCPLVSNRKKFAKRKKPQWLMNIDALIATNK
jgi:hypothetical protein